jgi:hypothetical protein
LGFLQRALVLAVGNGYQFRIAAVAKRRVGMMADRVTLAVITR